MLCAYMPADYCENDGRTVVAALVFPPVFKGETLFKIRTADCYTGAGGSQYLRRKNMEENREYITVKELAEMQGVSVQSIYQRLNTTLKPFIKVVKGKKCLDISVLKEFYGEDLKGFKQDFKDFKQGFSRDLKGDNDTVKLLQDTLDTLRQQLEQKDKQIAELTKSLQFEQGKSKSLEDKVLQLEDKTAAAPEPEKENKRSWLRRLFG